VLSGIKLIAEPWDLGPGGYQVGGFPPGWAEWNDRFRDTVRGFWKGDAGMAPELAARLCASADKFNRRGRKPWASVNFVTAHDGFTLNDLVSYDRKHNLANGEDNRDGNNNNRSWNHGVEGPTDHPGITALRERQKRNFLATLLLAQGTPMLLAGDEMGRTQCGNNNAYCQDNAISWVDWTVDHDGESLRQFVRTLTALRHRFPLLRRGRFLTGEISPELRVRDVSWVNAFGGPMALSDWTDANTRCFAMLLDGRAQATGVRRPSSEATLLWLLNAHHDGVPFSLPSVAGGRIWQRLFDTAEPEARQDAFRAGRLYSMAGRSTALFVRLD
jgi:glycogen operon protein